MFGSKLRSWMENHIVRPRKKGNKNKNNANSVPTITTTSTAASSHDVYKKNATIAAGYVMHHSHGGGGGNATTAPMLASSVPAGSGIMGGGNGGNGANGVGINGGNSGGCSSVISSPVRRREVSPIQNHTKSRYGWQSPDQDTVTSPKSDNFLYAPQHHRVRATHHQSHAHTAPPSKENSTEEPSISQRQSLPQSQPQPHPADCSSSSISSLSWSTGSKEPSMHSNLAGGAATANIKRIPPPPPPIEIHTHAATPDDDPNAVHYEEICTLLRHPDQYASNSRSNMEYERPKSEQLSTFKSARVYHENNHSQDDASTRYGRILPSRMQPQSHLSCAGSNDSLHGPRLRSGSAECIPSDHRNPTHQQAPAYATGACYQPPTQPATALLAHTQRGTPSNRFRTGGRGPNQSFVGAHGAVSGVAPPLHSLSSPESAYSTGYSTDGTSPGAIYTPPEYYINMRTGTHYFPKSINSLAIEAQRYKFGLNKIEEMSPIDPLPKTTFASVPNGHHNQNHGHVKMPHFAAMSNEQSSSQSTHSQQNVPVGCHSPLALRNTIILPTLKGFESPSPRQRCRIRTNPWYSTTDTSSSGATIAAMQAFLPIPPLPVSTSSTISSSMSSACSSSVIKMEVDVDVDVASISSCGGIKSSNENGLTTGATGTTTSGDSNSDNNNRKQQLQQQQQQEQQQQQGQPHNGKTSYESSESSSSLTEVENMKRLYSPNTIKRKRSELLHRSSALALGAEQPVADDMLLYTANGNMATSNAPSYQEVPVSDDDATLNEMMGKFDESYVYEKETDILSSDSDPTDCPSDLDTGQDAGDECDTDELLDIDFIDTASIQEIHEGKDSMHNLGNCYYYSNSSNNNNNNNNSPVRGGRGSIVRSRRRSRSSLKTASQDSQPVVGGAQRRRKRFLKTRKKSNESREAQFVQYSSPMCRSRESRSVGGTPVSLRRNHHANDKETIYKTSPLSNRSSSLVFTDASAQRFMTIAESERALLRADLEADVKYRQLILEAESILVSMKSSMQSIPRETPVASPRRVNPLANKRVEMLKNCEVEVKRDNNKQPQQSQRTTDVAGHSEQELAAAIHKRIESLKYGTASAPNSPKFSRYSPRKTHLTNFINQNQPPEVPPRKSTLQQQSSQRPHSPQLQLNGRRLQGSPVGSPASRRRFRSHSPKFMTTMNNAIDSDSDHSDLGTGGSPSRRFRSRESIKSTTQFKRSEEDVANCNYLPEIARIMLYDEADAQNRNICDPLGSYCPQSEPLKRKVYKGSSTFERIKKSFDLESEIPKQAMLAKINLLRRERQSSTAKLSSPKSSCHDLNQKHHSHINSSLNKLGPEPGTDDEVSSSSKKQLILHTIADLKRSLENQSVELNGLNEEN